MLREEAIEVLNKMKYPQKVNKNGFIISNVNIENEALEMAIKALSQEPCTDAVSRKPNCIDCIHKSVCFRLDMRVDSDYAEKCGDFLTELPSVTQKSGKWIPVSERLPEDTYPVNITWVNHDPEPYYATIKDKPFTATGCYCDGKWYWYSVTCQDYLDEYGRCDVDAMDDDIEVIAWMSLPKPYEPQESEDKE